MSLYKETTKRKLNEEIELVKRELTFISTSEVLTMVLAKVYEIKNLIWENRTIS